MSLTYGNVLMVQGKPEALEPFETIQSFSKKFGLNINLDKAKIMMENVGNPIIEMTVTNLVMKVAENTAL